MDAAEADDIAAALADGLSAQQVAHQLIVPLNDVLTVQQQQRRDTHPAASSPDRPVLRPVPPSPEPAVTTPPPSTMADLLERARATGDKRISRLADAAQTAHDRLTAQLGEHERNAEARARVAKLAAELAAAKAALRPTKTTAPPRSTVSTAVMRAWARSAGHSVPDKGMLPRPVVDAYYAAHPDAKAG